VGACSRRRPTTTVDGTKCLTRSGSA